MNPAVTETSQALAVSLRGGTGNRLLGLLSGLVCAQTLNLEATFFWQPDSDNPTVFGDLFEEIDLPYVRILSQRPDDRSWPREMDLKPGQLGTELKRLGRFNLRAYGVFGEELLPAGEFQQRLRAILRTLKPVSAIQESIARMPRFNLGLHARMTDHLPCRIITPRWCYTKAVECALRELPREPIFICSDTPSYIAEIIRNFPRDVLSLPAPHQGAESTRNSVAGVQHALAELWTLASCKLIMASRASSFARVAQLLGGGKVFELSGVPNLFRARQEALAWTLYSSVAYNLRHQSWSLPPKETRKKSALSGLAAVLLARACCSGLYQSLGNPFERRRLDQNLTEYFRKFRKKIETPVGAA